MQNLHRGFESRTRLQLFELSFVPRPAPLLTIDWHADWRPFHSPSIREVDEWANGRRVLGRSTGGGMGGGKARFVFRADDGARFTGTAGAT